MPPTNPAELREKIARVIAPVSWGSWDAVAGTVAIEWRASIVANSLAKADAILSLLEREPVPEVDRERVEKIAAQLEHDAHLDRLNALAAEAGKGFSAATHLAKAADVKEANAAALRTLLAQVPTGGAGWRDISTAPKDGTRVLCAWRNGDMCTATLFEKTVRAWINPPHFWQPLPQPPQESPDAVST